MFLIIKGGCTEGLISSSSSNPRNTNGTQYLEHDHYVCEKNLNVVVYEQPNE